jgi:hypothetical protein
MTNIQTQKACVTQITVIECEPGKQAEALSLMTDRARFIAVSMAVASSTTSNGKVETCCDPRTIRRSFARSGAASIR